MRRCSTASASPSWASSPACRAARWSNSSASTAAQIASRIDAETDIVVLNDAAGDVPQFAGDADLFDEAARLAWQDGRLEFVRESDFWALLGLVDADHEVHRLYTPVMLAELLNVPVQAIRHWHRKGRLIAARRVGRSSLLRL